MWDLPRPGIEPVSAALAGRFLSTTPPGKSSSFTFESQFPCLENVMDNTSLLRSWRRLSHATYHVAAAVSRTEEAPEGWPLLSIRGSCEEEQEGAELRPGRGGAARGEGPAKEQEGREEGGERLPGRCQHHPRGGCHAQMGPEAASVPTACHPWG